MALLEGKESPLEMFIRGYNTCVMDLHVGSHAWLFEQARNAIDQVFKITAFMADEF